MKISMPVKILIGILTAWVLIAPVIYVGAVFLFLVPATAQTGPSQLNPNVFPAFFFPILFLILCTAFVQLALQAFYIIHLILNRNGADVTRAVLGVGLFVLPFIAMPVYYFVFILPQNPPSWALAVSPAQSMPSIPTPPMTPPPAN